MTNEGKFIIQMIRQGFATNGIYDVDNLDWNEVINQLEGHRIFTNAFSLIKSLAPEEYIEEIESRHARMMRSLEYSLELLEKFAIAAKEERIRFVLIKGFALSKRLYGDLFARQFNDLDVLVEEDDMVRAHHILREIGYKQPYIINKETKEYVDLKYPVSRVRQAHHWFIYYHMDRYPWQKFELHRKINFATMEQIKDHLWNVEKVQIGSVEVNIPNLQYSFISLVLNTYQDSDTISGYQGKSRLRGYVELYDFIKKYRHVINWEDMGRLLKEYGYIGITNRVLNHLYELYEDGDLLSLKQCDADEDTRFWEIPMSFNEYMFDDVTRKNLIRDSIKKDVFSPKKSRKSIGSIWDRNAMWKHDTMHPVEIEYYITHSPDGLQLYVLLDSRIVADIENYMFQFLIYNNITDSPLLYSLVEFVKEDDFKAYIVNTPYRQVSGILRHSLPNVDLLCEAEFCGDKILLSSEVKYSAMNIPEQKKGSEIAVVFNWFKQLHPRTFNIMEDKNEVLYDPEVFVLE